MELTRPSPRGSKESCSFAAPVPLSASNGNEAEVAPATNTTPNTSAPAATRLRTELKGALDRRKLNALTPYHPEVWYSLLQEAGIYEEYAYIVSGLCHGFIIGLPNISSTQAPPNRESVAEFKEEFARIVEHEIIKGRYIGPISYQDLEALLGPFQSSPFSIIPKPGKIGKYRNVQNYSFPICPSLSFPNQSINSLVDSDSFPTTWGTFSLVSLLIHRLPPGSQLATRDVAEAYRTIPLHHSQWPATVVRLDEFSFAIDTSVCFGSGPSAGTYGEVRNAASDILRFQGIGPISSWVDDHLFFRIKKTFLPEYNERRKSWNVDITQRGRHQHGGRFWYGGHVFEDGTIEEFDENCRFPVKDLSQRTERSAEDTLYTYNFADIDFYSLQLGIPWELSKDRPFACVTTYIGFDWDVESYQVSLGHTKKEKYLRVTEEWLVLATHTLEEVQKLYGKLLHACLVVPTGRAYLTELEAMLGIFHHSPFLPRSSPKGLRDDLKWWIRILQQPTVSRAIPHPLPLYDVHGYSDASSKIGIAITICNRWRAWRLVPGWQSLDGQRDIGWAEAVAFECLIRSLVENGKETHNFIIYGDNKGVVEGWWNGCSRNRAVNGVFKRLHSVIADSPIRHSFHTSYVRSKDNPADAPSRGIYPPTHLLLPPIQLPPELNRFLVDSQSPFTPTEQRLLREGRYPTATAKRIEDSNERDKARIRHSLGALRQAEIGRDF
jgi:hypothetical protein